MKKFFLVLSVLVLLGASLLIYACNQAEAHTTDLVGGIPPASTAFAGIHGYAEELAKLPPAERAAHLKDARPQLEEAVVYFLRSMGRIKDDDRVERVEIFFGSVERTEAFDGNGKKHKGYFRDELVARVHLRGGKNEDVLVRCLNLWLELPEHIPGLQRLSSRAIDEASYFTVGKGRGLVSYVDYAVAMDLSQRHNLPLYRGKSQSRVNRITPEEARRLEARTDWVQVTVGVVEGDHFDLRDRSFAPSPRRR